MRRMLLPLLLLLSLPAVAGDTAAPPLRFAAGTVLAGGHVLRDEVTLPARPGPVTLVPRAGAALHWQVTVEAGETRLLDDAGRWAAKAEYHRITRDGRPACQIYQTTISPEWAVHGRDAMPRADYRPADDRVYSFRDTACPD